tara:strand:+ start:1067 stop:1804 length:738 start_codon:yes stop_codon:yes gene_type:complete
MSLVLDTHGSQHVTLDALRTIPTPQPRGSRHQPIPHASLVDALIDGITGRGWTVRDSDLGISQYGAQLFGTLDLRRATDTDPEMGTMLGFRSSTNSSMSIRGVAGKRVFVCSNMCLSGSTFVMQRKSTTRLDLSALVADGLDRFLVQSEALSEGIDRLKNTTITDAEAKARIFDLFNASVLPSRLLQPLARHYFHPTEAEIDCHPRTLWGLNNASTRSIGSPALKPAAQFDAAQNIGRHFQLAAA